jgi:hypothetical protein
MPLPLTTGGGFALCHNTERGRLRLRIAHVDPALTKSVASIIDTQLMSTEVFRGTSQHQFLGCRNELSAQLEVDRRKGQDGFGRRLCHPTRCDPSGSSLYRRRYRLGGVNHYGGELDHRRWRPCITTASTSRKSRRQRNAPWRRGACQRASLHRSRRWHRNRQRS